jgi:uracil-DNA glycosylase
MNLVGCRPSDAHRWEQEDRPPTTLEKVACSERTLMLLRAIRPRVVLCLGKIATSFFFEHPPPVNTWTTIRPAGHPEDRVYVAHLRHPSFLARSVMVPKQYKEYAAAVRFYQRLAERLPQLTKVSRWRFHPKYVEWLQVPEVGA